MHFKGQNNDWRTVAAAFRSDVKHADCGQETGERQIRNNAVLIQ
jgi:hypothetical protein